MDFEEKGTRMRHATLAPGNGEMDNPASECSRDQKKIEETFDAVYKSPASENASAVAKRREFVRLAEANNISLTREMWAVFEALLDLEGGASHCGEKHATAAQNLKTCGLKDARFAPVTRRLSI